VVVTVFAVLQSGSAAIGCVFFEVTTSLVLHSARFPFQSNEQLAASKRPAGYCGSPLFFLPFLENKGFVARLCASSGKQKHLQARSQEQGS
jgi:hypothetical protein